MVWQPGRTYCIQFSVEVARWPDKMLTGMFVRDGRGTTAQETRTQLSAMKARGYTSVPCGHHECNEHGECQGEPTVTN